MICEVVIKLQDTVASASTIGMCWRPSEPLERTNNFRASFYRFLPRAIPSMQLVCGPSRDCSAGWLIVVCQLRYPSYTGQRPDGPIVLVFCPIMKVLFWLPYPLQRQGPQGKWFVREHHYPFVWQKSLFVLGAFGAFVGLACCTHSS